MIKTNELRKGNWVVGSHSETPNQTKNHQVTGFDLYGQRHSYFAPIPLTPEILISSKLYKEKSLLGSEYLMFQTCTSGFELHYRLNYGDFIYLKVDGSSVSVTSVHQLQNLYFTLTGEELEVKF